MQKGPVTHHRPKGLWYCLKAAVRSLKDEDAPSDRHPYFASVCPAGIGADRPKKKV